MSSLNSTKSSRCQGGGRGWAGRGGPADPVPAPQASAARQERLLRRADEERAQAAGQGAKATRLRRELAGLLRRRERLAQRLRSFRGFGEYLQGVLPSMGQVGAGVPVVPPCMSPSPLWGVQPCPEQPPYLRSRSAPSHCPVPGRPRHAGPFWGAGGGAGSPGTTGRSRVGAAGPAPGTAPAVPRGGQRQAPLHQQ